MTGEGGGGLSDDEIARLTDGLNERGAYASDGDIAVQATERREWAELRDTTPLEVEVRGGGAGILTAYLRVHLPARNLCTRRYREAGGADGIERLSVATATDKGVPICPECFLDATDGDRARIDPPNSDNDADANE